MFMEIYSEYIDSDTVETIESIEELSKNFDIETQNKILSQSNIYIDPAYQVPAFETVKDIMVKRLDTIKDNMYTLPILNTSETPKSNKPRDAIIFCEE